MSLEELYKAYPRIPQKQIEVIYNWGYVTGHAKALQVGIKIGEQQKSDEIREKLGLWEY